MSQYDTGKFADYTPPPPPPRSAKSPWLWVGLGCGGLLLLGFGGCAAFVATIGTKMKAEMAKPYDPAATQAAMGDTPVYPGSTQDEMTTKALRVMEPMMKLKFSSATIAGVAYNTSDDFTKVAAWYSEKLQKAGYTPKKEDANLDEYQKGEEIITLQDSKNKVSGRTTFMIMRLHGVKN
jgi:hypothetical protein